jgi:hypothetical protein
VAKCSKAGGTFYQGHDFQPAPNGWDTCRNGCGARRRTPQAQTNQTVDRLGQRSSPLDNKAGCLGMFGALITGGVGLLYAAAEVAWRVIA